jgi:hypothetical protein
MKPPFSEIVSQFQQQSEGFGVVCEDISIDDSNLKSKLGRVELDNAGVRLTYESYVYEVFYWLKSGSVCMFHANQPTFTVPAYDAKQTVLFVFQEIKSRAAART